MLFTVFSSLALLAGLQLSSAAPVPNVHLKRAGHLKKGSAYNSAPMAKALGSSIQWAYNWADHPDGDVGQGVEYMPMLWSATHKKNHKWFKAANAALKSGSKHLLGFNEPDHPDQANMTPDQAVAAWKTNMEPFHKRAHLVSPAVTNGAGKMGQGWLDEFLAKCTGCHISAVALHIYDDASNIGYYQGYLSDAVAKYQKQGMRVWVTEMGVNSGDPKTFLETMVPFLDSLKGLRRYAFFMSDSEANHLNNADTSLTEAGKAYRDS